MLDPTDRTFFPPGRKRLSVGPRQRTRVSVSAPAGVFFAEFYQRAWYMSQPASVMSQPASVTHAQLISSAFGASQEV
jgi:hypothetical protein